MSNAFSSRSTLKVDSFLSGNSMPVSVSSARCVSPLDRINRLPNGENCEVPHDQPRPTPRSTFCIGLNDSDSATSGPDMALIAISGMAIRME
ncbi:hypothetical protein [Pandoraea aquatica]|uniref:hypothetical protein n=1 Tax=Pandoraea aquatica TaxID=2508290 RepID=UPI0015826F33|nr:hypothetical protein [Pandoraea aquatica]